MDAKKAVPLPHPAVVFRPVSDGAVLLHTKEEVYFGLNAVGAKVWQLLGADCPSISVLCERLAETYPDVDPAVLRTDVEELLEELKKNQLVQAAE